MLESRAAPVQAGELVAEAESIGSILRHAIEHDQVPRIDGAEDLYQGIAGIALFLAYLSKAAGRCGLLEAAEQALEEPRRALRGGTLLAGGAYAGSGSIVWTLMHWWSLTGNTSCLDEALDAVDHLARESSGDKALDIVSGGAGLVMVLLELHRLVPSCRALEAACLYAGHLVKNRIRMSRGCGWRTLGRTPLAGYAHGSAGISAALFCVADVTGDDSYAEAARQGLEYERSVYWREYPGCPVLRGEDRPDASSARASWCYGAGGIAMSRFMLPPAFVGQMERQEIDAALEGFAPEGPRPSDCLCHGVLGDVDLLLSASRRLARPDLHELALSRVATALERRRARGKWSTPGPVGSQALGVMYGLASVGYGLLRAADPDGVPSLLSFDSVQPRKAPVSSLDDPPVPDR